MSPLTPQSIPQVFKQAQIAQSKGDLTGAVEIYQSIAKANASIPEVHFQLGQIAVLQGKLRDAGQAFLTALRLKPSEPAIWQAVLTPLKTLRDPSLAKALSELAAKAALPPPLQKNITLALKTARATSKAAATVVAMRIDGHILSAGQTGQTLMRAHPKDYVLALETAIALSQSNALKDAFKAFQAAHKLQPDAPFPQTQSAVTLQRLGDFEAAEKILFRLIRKHPTLGEPYWLLVVDKKLSPDDPLIAKMKKAASKATDPVSKMFLGYALGKVMQDIKADDHVFEHLETANAIGRKMYPYKVKTRLDEVDALIASFQDARFERPDTETDCAPLFVTGMPRSGTTLVEQIIASHPMVVAGGETGYPLRRVYEQIFQGGRLVPYRDIGQAQKTRIAEAYTADLRSQHSFETFITDKSIQSHLVIGPLLNCLPNARVVVVHRDPRDVALSCFKNFFPEGTHRYSNDLEDLAQYILSFQKIVRFWRDTLPKGAFFEIRYEDLIAAPESQSKALIEACGLDWDDACLNFHQNTGPVNTLSVAQVRQPIYKTSARGWEKYAAELQPLIKILESNDATF